MLLDPCFTPLDSPSFSKSDRYDFTVIIPTIGKSSIVPPTYSELVNRLPPRTQVIVVLNPVDAKDASITSALLNAMGAPEQGSLEFVTCSAPIGFGGAINVGFAHAQQSGGLGRTIVIFNDDIRATTGWLESLDATLHSAEFNYINLITSVPDPKTGLREKIDRDKWGKVGICGPVTTVAAGVQGAVNVNAVKEAGGHEAFSVEHRARTGNEILSANFLSGYLMGFSLECAEQLLIPCPLAGFGPFDSEQFPIAGYEDNDICVRAKRLGWKLAVDYSNYVGHIGHQSFDSEFQDMQRGMKNRFQYYKKHESFTQRENQRLIGTYRVRIGSVYDLHLLRASLTRHAAIMDGVSILLTNNPARDMPAYPDWTSLKNAKESDKRFVSLAENTVAPLAAHDFGCLDTVGCDCDHQVKPWFKLDDIGELQRYFSLWVTGVLLQAPLSRFRATPCVNGDEHPQVKTDIWCMPFNERDERNKAIENAYSLKPDWIWSVDGDECIEDRIKRIHFDRWMTHPDPLVRAYDFAWLDHWNDTRHFRTDAPWGDAGRYEGGRHGRRLWRASEAGPGDDKILLGTDNGLHCGNIPDVGPSSLRITGARFRHFGYVRPIDRMERYKRYQILDPHPDPTLVGGTSYGHIISAEGMRMEFFNAHNGVALHMLIYKGTDPGGVASLLDQLYSMVDHIVLVWTDDEDPEDVMSEEMSNVVSFFKADLLHVKLRDEHGVNFAATRNAAINHISEINTTNSMGLGWGLFFDPDESMSSPLDCCVTIRRAAEATETYGWMFRYINPLRTGQNTSSESIRLHRLSPSMRMRNRVHESFDSATRHLVDSGVQPSIRVITPHVFYNAGLSDPTRIDAKLEMYSQGLLAELREHPDNGGAWHSLGLQLEAEFRLEEAMACYMLACQTVPTSYIGFRAVMAVKLREALAFSEEAVSRLSPAHDWYKIGVQIRNFLRSAASPTDNPATKNVLEGISIPFPSKVVVPDSRSE